MSPRGQGQKSDKDSGDGVPWRADPAEGGLMGAVMASAVWSSGLPLGTLGGGFGSPHARLQSWAGGPMGWPPPPSVSSGGPWRGARPPVPTQLCWGGRARRGTQMLAPWAQDVPSGAQAGSSPAPLESGSWSEDTRYGEPVAVRARRQHVLLTPVSAVFWARPAPLGMQQG